MPSSVPAPLPDEATLAQWVDRFIRHVCSIDGDQLRSTLAGAQLGAWSPPLAVAIVGLLVRRARDNGSAADTLAALSRALATGRVDPEHLEACRDAARSKADRLVQALFGTGRANREYVVEEEQFVDRRLRSLSLGERRALSRTRDGDWLARLAHDQDPRVIRELLRNPRCTEREAIIAASRRPTHSDVLDVVLASRFGTRNHVRLAVAHNPYAPVALASRALATLTTAELGEIVNNPHVAEVVRQHARDLQRGRRPTAAERHARKPPPSADGESIADALAGLLAQLEGEGTGDEAIVALRSDGTPLD